MPRKHNPRKKSVSFHDAPVSDSEKSKYKDLIKRAKQKQRPKPGDMENTPRFDELEGSWSEATQTPTPRAALSETTKSGLKAVAAATEDAQAAATNEDDSPEVAAPRQEEPETQEEFLTPEAAKAKKLQAAIEGRLSSIDIGEYLLNGEATQTVPIIPKKLVVVFRTVTDMEESYVDTALSENRERTAREFLRHTNELALAMHIQEVNGSRWPSVFSGDGNINEASVARRLSHVKKLSSPIFNLMTQNLSWFLERVSNALTVEALGNG